MNSDKIQSFESIFKHFFDEETRGLAPDQLAQRKEAWRIIERLYRQQASEESFIDYFWTFRFIHYPIFRVLSSAIPSAQLYHTVSTGYAGLLAVVAKIKHGKPMMLTEHGIYTRERRIEISRADWIYENDQDQLKVRKSQSRFKDLWNKMFTSLSSLCYEYADAIVTLYGGNQEVQLSEGADPKKCMIIPNGLDISGFADLKKEPKRDPDEFVLGFMGRVVSIKDVKTFIRACKGVAETISNLKVYLMGPTDEEQSYYEECVSLTEFLGLKNIIHYTGKVNVKEYYPKIDVLVLTSISEAQPLVILEAYGLGIPVVATDVGACREMVYGMTAEDKALGQSGFVAGITNSDEIAKAVIKLWKSPQLRETMGNIGKKRVANFYNKANSDKQYNQLYEKYVKLRQEEPYLV
ncbi:GT4 family glycosyltransferase PelF [bacterium]|nr:GT4 family glycosyltransferase PelF [bacterium]